MNLDELPIRLRNHKEALANAIEALTLAKDRLLLLEEERTIFARASEFYRGIVEEISGKGRSNALVALKQRALKAEAEAESLRAETAQLRAAVEDLTELAQVACSVCEGLGYFPLSENVDNKCTWCNGTGMRSYKGLLEQEQREHARTESVIASASALLEDAAPHVETAWNHEGEDSIKTVLDRISLFLRNNGR